MDTSIYLDRLLLRYSGSFNIYQPYTINDKEYPAYGYFFSCIEKYVLVREANMWTSKSYEHILFLEVQECTPDTISEIDMVLKQYMESELVLKNSRYPEKNHMYSYLSIALISQKPFTKEIEKTIKHYKYDRSYLLNFRGYSQARIMAVSLDNEQFVSNYAGRCQKSLYQEVFDEVHNNKPGFKQIMSDNGFIPFTQP